MKKDYLKCMWRLLKTCMKERAQVCEKSVWRNWGYLGHSGKTPGFGFKSLHNQSFCNIIFRTLGLIIIYNWEKILLLFNYKYV